MRSLLITVGSLALTAGVLTNAYLHKRQFYPSVVYITKSSPSMAVLYLQALVAVVILGKVMRRVFFSQLRSAEMEHLIERSWYAVTETCLAFTVFRDDFSPRFVALFTILLFLKCFHWLAEDRIDYMERSPVITLLFHVRAVSLLLLLAFLDTFFVQHAYSNTLIKGPSVQLVFGFEYAILLTMVVHIFVKYVLHTIDVQSENPWESKAVYLLYTEVVLGFVKCLLYVIFLAIMIKVHTFPLFVIRPMYLTIREFKKALNDVVMSRRAIRNMNTLYPDATPEELASGDNVCIICREEMHTSCKKLPCNHIFHTNCLRSWFQRQQTCPTCRMDVLRPGGSAAAAAARAQPAAAAPAAAAAPQLPGWPAGIPAPPAGFQAWLGAQGWAVPQAGAAPQAGYQGWGQVPPAAAPAGFAGWGQAPPVAAQPQWPPQAAANVAPPNTQSTATTTTTTTGPATAQASTPTPSTTGTPTNLFSAPNACDPFTAQFMMQPPYMSPYSPGFSPYFSAGMGFPPSMMMPAVPPGLVTSGLSTEELRRMEGEERASVEARIQCLQDINVLLTAAFTQMNQLTSLSAAAPAYTRGSIGRMSGAGGGGGGIGGGNWEFPLPRATGQSASPFSNSQATSTSSVKTAATERLATSDAEGAVGGAVEGAVGGVEGAVRGAMAGGVEWEEFSVGQGEDEIVQNPDFKSRHDDVTVRQRRGADVS